MILYVSDILKDAMGLIGVIEIDETPTSSDMNIALRTANVMIDRWSSQRLLLRSTTPLDLTLTPGKAVYTIGSVGADFLYPKPIKLYSAYYRDSGDVDTPVEIIEITAYNNLMDKTVSTGPPIYVAYDAGNAQQSSNKGSLSVYLAPDTNYTLHLECDSYLTEFVNISDIVTFEPAYYEALIYNLAERLFRHFNDPKAVVPADIVLIAHDSLNNLKAMNSVRITAAMDIPGKVGSYNIYSDTAV